AHRKVEALEHGVERFAPVGIAPHDGAVPALEGGGLEQAAIQEWQPAQRPRGGRALCRRAVQGSEAEWMEDRAVEVAPPGERLVEAKWEVPAVAAEPALLLDEVQEQHARERGQGEGVAIGGALSGGRIRVGGKAERGWAWGGTHAV